MPRPETAQDQHDEENLGRPAKLAPHSELKALLRKNSKASSPTKSSADSKAMPTDPLVERLKKLASR
ncbi:hypothetical protein [Roseateles violae]|uniref:Uncharacterized protein n=1 Tax=Roseateles violae TaxID=3058042 RepID=A0ABT8DPZ5_9BURK|nr:hypothetical protein [Pelomonas sp. PFR6]MDN3919110.1 hypothetical protein [Pelomonas sp. PFR6]